jgi:hypothetical protein
VRLGRLSTLLFVSMLAVSQGGANEPDGRTILRYAWAGAPGAHGGTRVLRLSITAATSLRDLRIKLEGLQAFRLKPRTFSGSEKALGDLEKGESASLEFDVLVPAAGGGIASFVIEGTAGNDRPFKEGIGVPIGTPGAVPALRAGAAEFPASSPQGGNP